MHTRVNPGLRLSAPNQDSQQFPAGSSDLPSLHEMLLVLSSCHFSIRFPPICLIFFLPSEPVYISGDLKCLYQCNWETPRPLRSVSIVVHGMYTGLGAEKRAQGAWKTSALEQTEECTDFGKMLLSDPFLRLEHKDTFVHMPINKFLQIN